MSNLEPRVVDSQQSNKRTGVKQQKSDSSVSLHKERAFDGLKNRRQQVSFDRRTTQDYKRSLKREHTDAQDYLNHCKEMKKIMAKVKHFIRPKEQKAPQTCVVDSNGRLVLMSMQREKE